MEAADRINLSRLWTLIFFAALLASLVVGQIAAAVFNWSVLIFQTLPLLIFLPGLIQGKGKAYVWLGCILLVYSGKFISDMVVSHGSWISLLQTFCCVGLFCSALLYIHWRGKLRKANSR